MNETVEPDIDTPEWVVQQLMAVGRRRQLSAPKLTADRRLWHFLDRPYVKALVPNGTRAQRTQALVQRIEQFCANLRDPITRTVVDYAFAISENYHGASLTESADNIHSVARQKISRDVFKQKRAEALLELAQTLLAGVDAQTQTTALSGAVNTTEARNRLQRDTLPPLFHNVYRLHRSVRHFATHLEGLLSKADVNHHMSFNFIEGFWEDINVEPASVLDDTLYWYARFLADAEVLESQGHFLSRTTLTKDLVNSVVVMSTPFSAAGTSLLRTLYKSAHGGELVLFHDAIAASEYGDDLQAAWSAWIQKCSITRRRSTSNRMRGDDCEAHGVCRNLKALSRELDWELSEIAAFNGVTIDVRHEVGLAALANDVK